MLLFFSEQRLDTAHGTLGAQHPPKANTASLKQGKNLHLRAQLSLTSMHAHVEGACMYIAEHVAAQGFVLKSTLFFSNACIYMHDTRDLHTQRTRVMIHTIITIDIFAYTS